jgi:glycosyltransferase involved in cell wall biosynthesis
MSTVEAMQNGCLPIVFDGGGQREIVENGISGYRFSSISELLDLTRHAIRERERSGQMALAARQRGATFTRSIFAAKVLALFRQLTDHYASGNPL